MSTKNQSIARFMAARKRQLLAVPRTFPKYREGMTTGEYINAFSHVNPKHTVNLLPFDYSAMQ